MKVNIKLARRHPQRAMAFGRYMITEASQELELNDAEIKDLQNDGPKYWFEFSEVKDEVKAPKKKAPVKKKVAKKDK